MAIGEPDYPTRLAILRQKAAERGLALSEEDACTLARTITGSVRRLEGALNRLRAGELGGDPLFAAVMKGLLEE